MAAARERLAGAQDTRVLQRRGVVEGSGAELSRHVATLDHLAQFAGRTAQGYHRDLGARSVSSDGIVQREAKAPGCEHAHF